MQPLSTLLMIALMAFPVAAIPQDAYDTIVTVGNMAPAQAEPAAADPAQADLVPREELITVGEMAPDFTVSTLGGKEVQLSKLRGKVVVLSFWFKPCDACVYDLQYTQEFTNWIKETEDAPIVSLLMDEYSGWDKKVDCGDPPEDYRASIRAYLAKKNITMDALVDPDGTPVQKAFGVTAYPTRIVIDPDGRVAAVGRGNRGKRLPGILKSESLAAWHTWQAKQLKK